MKSEYGVATMEVAKGLYRIGSPLGARYVYQYLLVDDEGALLIDAGMRDTPEQAIIPFMEKLGLNPADLKMLLVSHSDVDHYSGVNRMRAYANHLVVMAHRADVPCIESRETITASRYFYYESLGVRHDDATKQWFLEQIEPAAVDVQLSGGETIRLGPDRLLDILHIPGHSAGHLAVYDRRNRAAIIIDGVLWKGLFDTNGQIISPPPYYDMNGYLRSIDKLLTLPIQTLLTGHYGVMSDQEAVSFLHESRQFVEQTAQVIEQLIRKASRPLSLEQILLRTNERTGPFTAMMVELVGPVMAHLQELENSGKIFRKYEGTIPYWFC